MRTMSIHWTGQVAQCDAMWDGGAYVGDLKRQSYALKLAYGRFFRKAFELTPS